MPRSDQLSEGAVAMLQEPQIANLATIMRDGTPQVTPVWVDVEPGGKHVLINTADGRLKAENTRRDANVALSVVDSKNPFRWVTVRGRVVEHRYDGAEASIDQLAKKYLGQDTYPFRDAADKRVLLVIEPTHVASQGV